MSLVVNIMSLKDSIIGIVDAPQFKKISMEEKCEEMAELVMDQSFMVGGVRACVRA
jgi:hypothetical protein